MARGGTLVSTSRSAVPWHPPTTPATRTDSVRVYSRPATMVSFTMEKYDLSSHSVVAPSDSDGADFGCVSTKDQGLTLVPISA